MSDFDRKALYSISYGVYIVTSVSDGKQNGQIANTVIQVTAEPPRIAVAINRNNLTHEYIEKSGVFGVSILDETVPMEFIGLFGFKSGRDTDKLSQVKYRKGVTGVPLVTDHALSLLEVEVVTSVDVGTHTIFIGDVVGGEVLRSGTPLTYATYHLKKKGMVPKTAPTYRPEEVERREKTEKGTAKAQRYVCNVCGWIYDPKDGDPNAGIPKGTPFEELPDDWTCPVCGAPKSEFYPETS